VDDWLLDVIKNAGYLGVALLMILENVIPAIPSELILPFAGFLVAKGDLNLVGVIASGSAGSTIGASAWYILARAWGSSGIHRFVGVHGRWILLDVDDVRRAEAWFRRHQRRATFLGRLMPGVRSLISVPAGVSGMSVARFLTFTVAGTIVWTSALTLAGYFLADAYERTREIVGPIGSVLFGSLILLLVVRYVKRRRTARDEAERRD
jgi:membrane protein DedA with SNARE-associated domain